MPVLCLKMVPWTAWVALGGSGGGVGAVWGRVPVCSECSMCIVLREQPCHTHVPSGVGPLRVIAELGAVERWKSAWQWGAYSARGRGGWGGGKVR